MAALKIISKQLSCGDLVRVVVASLVVLSLAGCDEARRRDFVRERKKGENYWAGLKEAQPSARIVNEFLALFPDANVKYRYFDGSAAPGFDAQVGLHGRYDLTMQLPVNFDAAGRNVTGYGDPRFYLLEVTNVEVEPSGVVAISYGRNKNFGLKEWNALVRSKGDFDAIGWTMITDKPIPGFTVPRDDQ